MHWVNWQTTLLSKLSSDPFLLSISYNNCILLYILYICEMEQMLHLLYQIDIRCQEMIASETKMTTTFKGREKKKSRICSIFNTCKYIALTVYECMHECQIDVEQSRAIWGGNIIKSHTLFPLSFFFLLLSIEISTILMSHILPFFLCTWKPWLERKLTSNNVFNYANIDMLIVSIESQMKEEEKNKTELETMPNQNWIERISLTHVTMTFSMVKVNTFFQAACK